MWLPAGEEEDGGNGEKRRRGRIWPLWVDGHRIQPFDGLRREERAAESSVAVGRRGRQCRRRASIKALMEEEMASGTQILKETQRNIFAAHSDDLNFEVCESLGRIASLVEFYRNHNGGPDVITLEGSVHFSNLIEKENNTDAGTHLKRIPSSFQKALEASRLLPCLQNLYIGSPKLELAESDEETNLKVTSNSSEQSEVSNYKVHKGHNSFLKEDKLAMRRPPKLHHNSLQFRHHFSLRELKRRLILAISNKRDNMSSAFQKDDSTKQFLPGSMSSSMPSLKVEVAWEMMPLIVSALSRMKKKRIIERLDNQRDGSSQMVYKSETFGRLISYAEHDAFSQTHCPQEDVILPQYSTDSSALRTIEQDDSSSISNPPRNWMNIGHGNHPFKDTISQEFNSEGILIMNDAVDIPQLSIEIENPSEGLEQLNTEQCFVEEPQSMNALLEVSLYSPEYLVNEQDNSSPSAVVH
ncbi:hypothetical protein ABZP36_002798 [Zizania latifolia]